MSSGSDPELRRPPAADGAGGTTFAARLWERVPVAVRAVIVGFIVLLAGNFLPQGLFAANLKWPAAPWSAALIAVYLWLYWQYVGGRWWPRSTSAARRRDLRAVPLSRVLWRWSLLAGALGIAALTTLTYALGRLVPLGLDFPEVLEELPTMTMVTMVVTISIMAGMVEEAAFRGYMQAYEDSIRDYQSRTNIFTRTAMIPIADDVISNIAPNPSRGSVTFSVSIPRTYGGPERAPFRMATPIDVAIYNVNGKLVRTLAGGSSLDDVITLRWDGRDGRQREVPSGIYFVRAKAGSSAGRQKIVLIR